jgi:energy-coupling factor transport system substrate-specific component
MSAGTSLLHFGRFYLLTSLAYDTFRAAGNVLMVLALGLPVLGALSRLRARLTFEVMPLDGDLQPAAAALPGAAGGGGT